MRILTNIIKTILAFTLFSLFFLKQEYRTKELSLFILILILGLLVNYFLITKGKPYNANDNK